MKKLLPAILIILGACSSGGASAPAESASGESEAPAASQGAASEAPSPAASEASRESTASAPGGITLTIGDETWEFDGALCAYYNAPAGEPGSEWNVSFKQGNNQVYVNVDSFGQDVSITDVVDYGTLQWVADGDDLMLSVDGNEIHAEGTFRDEATGADPMQGTLDATCASWFEG